MLNESLVFPVGENDVKKIIRMGVPLHLNKESEGLEIDLGPIFQGYKLDVGVREAMFDMMRRKSGFKGYGSNPSPTLGQVMNAYNLLREDILIKNQVSADDRERLENRADWQDASLNLGLLQLIFGEKKLRSICNDEFREMLADLGILPKFKEKPDYAIALNSVVKLFQEQIRKEFPMPRTLSSGVVTSASDLREERIGNKGIESGLTNKYFPLGAGDSYLGKEISQIGFPKF